MTIYKITIGTDLYVGSTVDYDKRKWRHISKFRKGIQPKALQEAYDNREEGIEPIYTVLESDVDYHELRRKECNYINLLQPNLNKYQSYSPLTHGTEILDYSRYDEVTELVDEGLTNKEISNKLKVSKGRVGLIRNSHYYLIDVEKFLFDQLKQVLNRRNLVPPKATT